MLKVEPKAIANSLFFRRTGDGTARTEPTGQTVLALRYELDRLIVERVRHQQAARDTEKAIRDAIRDGKDASQHRAALAKLDDTAEVLAAEVDHVTGLIVKVRRAATEHYATPIADAVQADIDAYTHPFEAPEHLT